MATMTTTTTTAARRPVMKTKDRASEVLRLILDSVADGVVVCDAEGRFTLFNPAAERLTGVGISEAAPSAWQKTYGMFLPDKTTPFPTDQIPLLRALRGESTDGVMMFLRNPVMPAGVHVSVSGRPLCDASGELKGAVVVFHDVTREVDLDRFREDMTALLVHDLKNPLAVILAAVDQAQRSLRRGSPDQALDLLADCQQSARRAVRLATTMLHVAKLEAVRPDVIRRPLQVKTWLARLLEHDTQRMRSGNLTLTLDVPEDLVIAGDEDLLTRVAENLIDNAIHHAPPGGRIVLRGRSVAGGVELRFANSGEPVPLSRIKTVFDKFHGLEPSANGAGLGLYFCRLALDAHGGTIAVEREPGLPAVFVVRLPG